MSDPSLLSWRWPAFSREHKAGIVLELRRTGHTFAWIADLCGISTKAAYKLAWDPDGSKKRAHNQKYQGVCIDCGGTTARTSSGNGGIGPAKRCLTCYREWQKATATGPAPRPSRSRRVRLGVPPPTPGWDDFIRAEKVERMRDLRALGHTYAEMAESVGVAISTVHAMIADPDLSKHRARRARCGLDCVDCGARISGKNGNHTPTRCVQCSREAAIFWTKEDLIERIQSWNETYGSPPTAQFWNPAMARFNGRNDLAERFERDGCWPQANVVQMRFGSWNAGIEAAGFTPRRRGGRGKGNPPAVALLA